MRGRPPFNDEERPMSDEAGRTGRRRPSGAMVVAVAAVVLAAVGTAIADPLASSSKLDKKERKQVRSISIRIVNGLAAGLSVASAQTAQQAANAANAANANTLDGRDSTEFVPAAGVIRIPTLEMVDDQLATVVDLPDVLVELECNIDNGGEDVVSASVSFATNGSVVVEGAIAEVEASGFGFPVFAQPHPAALNTRIEQSGVTIVSDEGTSLTGMIWTSFNLDGTTDRCFAGGHLIVSG